MTFFQTVLTCLIVLLAALGAYAEERKPKSSAVSEHAASQSVEDGIFEELLSQYPDLTYDQFKAQIAPPRYPTKLSFDPTLAKYFNKAANALKLNDSERTIFKRNGFVSVDHDQRYSFASAYYGIYTKDLPVLITTDSILHAMHSSYDQILLELETVLFSYTIDDILAKSHEELGKLAKQLRAPGLETHDRDVDLFITVARNLLLGAGAEATTAATANEWGEKDDWNGKLLVPSKLQQDAQTLEILQRIRSLILQTPGDSSTDLYGSQRFIDYSQFRPRGHYTKTTALRRYFRAMMWLGRVDCGWNLASDRELGNALLLTELLVRTESVNRLQSLDEILNFMIGRSDNLRVADLLTILQDQKLAANEVITTPAARERLRTALASRVSGQQRIRSQVLTSHIGSPEKVVPPPVFQLFGQRFVIDSFVLSKVVFDSIIYQGRKVERFMPTGLDVMAALGNNATIPLLASELMKYRYSPNIKASQVFVGLYDAAFWRESQYNIWLDALRVLDDDLTQQKHFPEVMRTHAWQMKQLQTQLASWAELRHDTILYAKQSYTASEVCEYPTGYVEPYPQFYGKIRFFAEETVRLFQKLDFTSPNVEKNGELGLMKMRQLAFFNTMIGHLKQLEQLAQKELAAQPFSAAEQLFLKKAIDARGGGSGGPNYDGWYCDLFYGGAFVATKWDPTVADVHTDPNGQQVLQVGVGDVHYLVAAIDNEKDRLVYVGPIFSYYEFTQPASKRLTDEEWQSKFFSNSLPSRPAWTSSFQGPREKRDLGP